VGGLGLEILTTTSRNRAAAHPATKSRVASARNAAGGATTTSTCNGRRQAPEPHTAWYAAGAESPTAT
jgi:hypothetical protein